MQSKDQGIRNLRWHKDHGGHNTWREREKGYEIDSEVLMWENLNLRLCF